MYKKYLDYKDWEKTANLILENNHYTKKGITKIDFLNNNMNLKTLYFNWYHLNNI